MSYAKARIADDGMNATERAYAQGLEAQRRAGRIRDWKREPIKLRLADGTFYTPDFGVVASDDVLELHETKGGYIREDANVKIKVAAALYPWFRFRLCCLVQRQWSSRLIGPEDVAA